MDNAHALSYRPRQAAGIGISLAVHAVLLALWQLAREAPLRDETTPAAMLLRLVPAQPAAPPPIADAARRLPAASAPSSAAPAAPGRAGAPAAVPAPAMREAPPEQVAAEPTPILPDASPAPPVAGSMLERARAAAGSADRAARKDNPTRGIVAPVVTPQMKLERGLARANELAPNKWYEGPKTEYVVDPSHYDRRRYRVVGAAGTYCVTYESNHAPDGLDTMRDGIKPKLTTCDEKWAPPTVQKWN